MLGMAACHQYGISIGSFQRKRYARWVEGLMARHGKSQRYAKEIIARLGEKDNF